MSGTAWARRKSSQRAAAIADTQTGHGLEAVLRGEFGPRPRLTWRPGSLPYSCSASGALRCRRADNDPWFQLQKRQPLAGCHASTVGYPGPACWRTKEVAIRCFGSSSACLRGRPTAPLQRLVFFLRPRGQVDGVPRRRCSLFRLRPASPVSATPPAASTPLRR